MQLNEIVSKRLTGTVYFYKYILYKYRYNTFFKSTKRVLHDLKEYHKHNVPLYVPVCVLMWMFNMCIQPLFVMCSKYVATHNIQTINHRLADVY